MKGCHSNHYIRLIRATRSVLVLFLFSLGLFSSCETNPPITPEINTETSKVFVTANITGAEIFVDNISTGKFTSDTIEAKVGNHQVRVEIVNYLPLTKTVEFVSDSVISVEFNLVEQTIQKIVLLEDFANVSCVPCVISNKIIQSLFKNTYGSSKLVIVKYPANFPSANDPMYLASKDDCNARMQYYNVLATPHVRIDGKFHNKPADSISTKEKINERLLLSPTMELSVINEIVGENLSVEVNISVQEMGSINFADFVLHTVVLEDKISYSAPPGSNGETTFYHVMRKMLPTNEGENLSSITGSGNYQFNRQMSVNSGWDKSKLEVIVFIQNTGTKEVIQAASTFN
ncbi:MAG: Omp28-related outer membrane protein [bacterium]